ncbi:hypothetical protein GIB67_043170 [Kingdonia uniflora]|uniref:Uncharacterized protein n=1 Tax=Kingdonia uniflora TaxID=39325 RepID=A0A7J7NJB3_9MAGN|nr:hypothetical protein GIB67_043170 [Kingdonia uniflora]
MLPENHLEFLAPPPSPVANTTLNRTPAVVNDNELSQYLYQSLHVPDLTLPDRKFPTKNTLMRNPPVVVDFSSLISSNNNDDSITKVLDSASGVGCFQIVNHGISPELIKAVCIASTGIFQLPLESKELMVSSLHNNHYGFEEFIKGKAEMKETSEGFVWCRDDKNLESVMGAVWSQGYSSFRQKMELLSMEIEHIASKVLQVLMENTPTKSTKENHEVYTKKGWTSFYPHQEAIVVTIGDQIQEWSCGMYKNVNGKPIFNIKEDEDDAISMAFLYSQPTFNGSTIVQQDIEKTISLRQQLKFIFILILVFKLYVLIRDLI